jgi:hypothetical protein
MNMTKKSKPTKGIMKIEEYTDEMGRRVNVYTPLDKSNGERVFSGKAVMRDPMTGASFPFEFGLEEATTVKEAFAKFDDEARSAGDEIQTEMVAKRLENQKQIVTPQGMVGHKGGIITP